MERARVVSFRLGETEQPNDNVEDAVDPLLVQGTDSDKDLEATVEADTEEHNNNNNNGKDNPFQGAPDCNVPILVCIALL